MPAVAHYYFGAFHKNLEEQYKPCPQCGGHYTLSDTGKKAPPWEGLGRIAEKAFKKLFNKGSYQPEDLFKTKEYKALINETTQVFNSAISHEVTADLRKHLEHGNLVFSGLKTHTQLTEARSFLKDEKGNIVPFYKFQEKILKLNQTYNKNYLEAEYEFAVQSAQSVENWQTFSDDTKRYWLEYRTAGDERVRADHDALRGICLPKNDPFWQSYYPPLGWRCRCTVVQVLASEKQLSDSQKARELGERATTQIGKTGKNKLEMFRFNPALEKRLFPKDNGYAPKHCDGDKVNLTGLLGYSKIILSLENERCRAKKIIEKEADRNLNKGLRKAKDAELNEWRKKHIPENIGITLHGKQFKDGKIIINRKSAKDVYSHFTEPKLKDLVKDIVAITKKGQFKMESPIDPTSHNYDKKIRSGYEVYRYYLAQHKGYNIRINTAVIKGEEFLYSLNLTEF